ncbi:hypothetical protein [Rivularia sp. UHCC 0363]|uniref:hypothetical protein n=1 Tax=Rivularia sp. UHCC 0363 TaxID=3110244 RepID=UPI002B22141B|nr:hypothetical protein [Rivularia sp. UHCC 0363]MEA5595739.1 hypothetical protein [Rivularia sp. UHCC 0363]
MSSQKIPLTRDQKQIIQEYCYLAGLKSLSEEQSEQMTEILVLAMEDKVIDFLITEADHFIGHKFNMIDEEECKNYQANLREYLLLDELEVDKILF